MNSLLRPGLLLPILFCFVLSHFECGTATAALKPLQSKSRQKKKTSQNNEKSPVVKYRSKNFILHTDLSKEEAEKLLAKLEGVLEYLKRYFRKRKVKPIECFIVKKLSNWPSETLAKFDQRAFAHIRMGGGLTAGSTIRTRRGRNSKAYFYAATTPGIPAHEMVHAFCIQAFGNTGPVWYSEGVAEFGKYWKKDAKGVSCPKYVAKYLRESSHRTIPQIVDRKDRSGDGWKNYAWRWALCHFMAQHPGYQKRFLQLGTGLMTGKRTSFQAVFGSKLPEISFEFELFLSNLRAGYRVENCAWDWKTKFSELTDEKKKTATVDASKGWQASGVTVKKGEKYSIKTDGTWTVEKGEDPVTADGDYAGLGRLMGVVYDDHKLSQPFELSFEGTFEAPADGKLYLRCRDHWNKLDDNSGKITVTLGK